MTKIASLLTLFASVLAVCLPTAPAHAQRDRVFVASYGSDSNPCTFGSPCKTFQNAVNVVAAGGEVTAIDSAGFGTIVISHAVTITSPNGVEAGIATPSGDIAIQINAGTTDAVTLNGITLDGIGGANAGIQFNSGGSLNLQNCVIRNFDNGIRFDPTASSKIFLSNTLVAANSDDAIDISASNSGSVIGVLDAVTIERNQGGGLVLGSAGSTVTVSISDSEVSANLDGIASFGTMATIDVMVRNSSIAANSNYGLLAEGSGAQMWVTRSTITGNFNGVFAGGGTITSLNDNVIVGNANDNTPSTTIGYQ
jgi:hypothetical protein